MRPSGGEHIEPPQANRLFPRMGDSTKYGPAIRGISHVTGNWPNSPAITRLAVPRVDRRSPQAKLREKCVRDLRRHARRRLDSPCVD